MLVKQIHGQHVDSSDYDLLIDDTNKDIQWADIFAGRGEWRINTIKNVVWKPNPDLKIEMIPLSQINPNRKKRGKLSALDLILSTTDFTMNSLGYDLHHAVLCEEKALPSIENREIELLYADATPPARYMTRLVIYAQRLQFTIGIKAREFVQHSYTPTIDPEIQKYLEIRKTPEEFESIQRTLRAIASQQ